jgi:predicted DNA repair protein MutK
MASGIFAILDDVAMLLDDAAVMSKVAAKKTAGLLGDDLAVNAEKATGFSASRELPVIWAITKGSFINKLIILPLAFLLSIYIPWLIVPVLLVGGAYLSYEGAEKALEWFFPHEKRTIAAEERADPGEIVAREKRKIRAAIRTDFILSVEIIIITLSTVIGQHFAVQVMVVTLISLLATVGVYGLVALLVRMDDTGYFLMTRAAAREGSYARLLDLAGQLLVDSLPVIIRLLGVIGTIAMLLVGGGMFVHNIETVHHWLGMLPSIAAELLAGFVVGMILLGVMHLTRFAKGAVA